MSDREAHWCCRSLLNHLDMLLVQPRTERLAKAAAAHNWHEWRAANVTAIGEAGNSDSAQPSGLDAVRDDRIAHASSASPADGPQAESRKAKSCAAIDLLETAAHMAIPG